MDRLDQQLIGLLRQNARMHIADLAQKLGVSRGTVNNRLRNLEDQHVIVGDTVRLISGIRSTETNIHLASYR